jgi:hypothetical protein
MNINNIIRFSFHFHETMGNKLHEFEPGYILEKWIKYFGELKPNPISDTTHVYLRNYLCEWIDKWGEGSYTEMSKYLSIIHTINTKQFRNFHRAKNSDYIQRDWLPSELLSIFERSTTGEMSNIEYRGIHSVVERELKYWLESKNVKEDMIKIQRDIKIELILNGKQT